MFGNVSVGWLSERVFKIREKRGGGVAFSVKTGVEFIRLKSDLEYLAITVCSNLTKFNICVVNRPPDHTCPKFLESLDTLLNEFRFLKRTPIIVGDFNIDIFSNDKKPEVLSYKLLLKSFHLDIFLSEPTRVTKISATCIDHWISEEFFPVTVTKSTISDHYALFGELPFTIAKADKKVCYARNVKILNRDDNLLKLLFLLHIELEKFSLDNSMSFKIQFLFRSMVNIFDRFCPSN